MIALFSALVGGLIGLQGVTPTFIEVHDASLLEVTAVAIVKLPALDTHERAMLWRVVQNIPLGPAEYSRNDLMAITGGRIVRCQVMPDHLMIEVPAFKEDLSGAVSVLAGVLKHARLDSTDTNEAEEADPWTSILHGPMTEPDKYKLRSGELQEFYQRIFRPEAVTVAVSGPFAVGAAEKEWDLKVEGWEVPKLLRPWPAAEPLPESAPRIETLELDGPEIAPDSPSIASSLLSLFALGCGKGGSLHRLAREQDGLSYRQEAVLWPTLGGWIPRLVVAAADLKDAGAAGATLKQQLIDDVNQWTEADRLRAVGLAEGVLLRGVPLSPFYFRSDRPVTGSPNDLAFLEAYWFSKTGTVWNAASLAKRLKGVSLEALKASSSELLSHSRLVIREPN